MNKVIYKFKDLEDNGYIYEVGDTYPREGYEPTLKRIRELSGKKNKIGQPLIEAVVEETTEEIMTEPEA